ncbi:MAG: nicotinate (nicotinamide) nucleotide adenylyltransferase [Bacteroidales bacterium]
MTLVNKHIGLFFGSFNPVHIGHLVIASQIIENSKLDQVWFVVSPQNPFKKKKTLLDNHHRLAMVKEAIDDDERFLASDVEFQMPQPSYTIHTLTLLSEQYPDRCFSLIMGMDNLETFQKWKNYQEILKNYNLHVYPRPNYTAGAFSGHPHVHQVQAPLMEISASMIRKGIQEGKNMRYLLPDKVLKYIDEMQFYT